VLDYQGLRAIVNQFPMGILLADEKGDILLGNDRAPALLGLDPLDLMERGLAAMPGGAQFGDAVDSLRKADRQKEQIAIPLGRRWLSLTLSKGGLSLFREPCILILITDVTEQRKLEEFRSAFLDELLHRILGPLTSVNTSLAFLSSDSCPMLPESLREVVSLGHAEVKRLHSLMSDMGELLSLEAHSAESELYLENVEVATLLNKCLRRLGKRPEGENREMVLEIPSSQHPFQVNADYEKLGSVLGHVIVNAMAHSPAASPVLIKVAPTSDGQCEIRIVDKGPGIPEKDLPRAFEKFYRIGGRAATDQEGSGLGLFIAKGYVELMKGSIRLESSPGQGTTVTIRLPLGSSEAWAE
jgi:two-component system, OmpR family, phosphate regulon sensor histidine kinase PhoR